MRYALSVAALCAAATTLCAGTPILPVLPSSSHIVLPDKIASDYNKTTKEVDAFKHFSSMNMSAVVEPIFSTMNMTSPNSVEAAFEQMLDITNSDTDMDALFAKAFPDHETAQASSAAALRKRKDNKDWLPLRPFCNMESIYSAECHFLDYCHFMCVQGSKNFPYMTCGPFLINNMCPEDWNGPHQDLPELQPHPPADPPAACGEGGNGSRRW